MHYLGIDYGKKRVGFAVGDDERGIAFPRDVISNNGKDLEKYIKDALKAESIAGIVLGLPRKLSGENSESTLAVLEFKKKLETWFLLPVHLEDEVFSTKAIQPGSTVKERTDAASAALILQNYLDRIKKQG